MIQRRIAVFFNVSNYCGISLNEAVVLMVSSNGTKKETIVFLQLKYMLRSKENIWILLYQKQELASMAFVKCCSKAVLKTQFWKTIKKTSKRIINIYKTVNLPMD